MKAWTKSTRLLDLPGYAYGELHVQKHHEGGAGGVVINPNCPGALHLAPSFRGPKDWSPYGPAPKDWTYIFAFQGQSPILLMAFYINIEGNNYMTRLTIDSADLQALYFVPM